MLHSTSNGNYPYTGNIYMSTIIEPNSVNGTVGQLSFIVDIKNKSVVSAEFHGFNKIVPANGTVTTPVQTVQQSTLTPNYVSNAHGLASSPGAYTGWGSQYDDPAAGPVANNIVSIWNGAGYSNCQALIGRGATASSVLDYLRNDNALIWYNNLGYADNDMRGGICYYTNGLYFYNSYISSSDIQNLNPDQGLYGSGVFIGSCYSFYNPLHDAFISHLPQFYIGGIQELYPPSVDYVSQDFWNNYLNKHQAPGTALINAEEAHSSTGCYFIYPF